MSLRPLRRSPIFFLTSAALLALGLGASAAIFAAFYAAVWKPLPYPEPETLTAVHDRFPALHLARLGVSSREYVGLRAQPDLFENAGAYFFLDLSRTGIPRPTKVNAIAATASLFDTLGIQPLLGRNFTAAEEQPNGPHTVILSERYWRRGFASDPNILSRTLELNGALYSVVGIMPASFQFPNAVTEMWTPIAFTQKDLAGGPRASRYLRMVARTVAPFDQASARLQTLSQRISRDTPELARLGWSFFILPLARDDDGSLRRWLYILFAAVACLLLIVCSNVAALMLAHSTAREYDLSVRAALGASRMRIAREVFGEMFVIALAGGAAAVWIAQAAIRFISLYRPLGTPKLDLTVYAFLAALTCIAACACAWYPAYAASRVSSFGAPKATAAPPRQRLRQLLLVTQVAVATALLASGALLIRSFVRLLDVSPGFDAAHILTMQISLPPQRYATPESRERFYAALMDRVRAIPGVEAASACTLLPFGWGENTNTFEIVGKPKPATDPFANLSNVLPAYFETMRIPLLRGRYINASDHSGTEPIAVIDDTMARRYFPNEDPIGRLIQMPWDKPFRIVGVVGSVKTAGLDIQSRPTLYFSASQYPGTDKTLVLRSTLPQGDLANSVQDIVSSIDKDQPAYDVEPLTSRIERTLATRRFVVRLILLFAATGTLLAALGLYGLLAYLTTLRRKEIGIRMALGAEPRAIARLIATNGLALTAAGILAGIALAAATHRYIASQLYATSFLDPATWAAVPAVILAAAALACALPARRAARVDPIKALREE